jgi:hypothetical protein
VIAAVIAAGLLTARPLDNFTANGYDGSIAAPHELRVDHVEDFAEIPADQAMPDVDANDGRPSAAELSGWAAGSCARAASSMRVTVDDGP